MSYEWDPYKAKANLIKHYVRFAEAVIALEDERALTIRDVDSEEEERWVTLGMDAFGRVLVACLYMACPKYPADLGEASYSTREAAI